MHSPIKDSKRRSYLVLHQVFAQAVTERPVIDVEEVWEPLGVMVQQAVQQCLQLIRACALWQVQLRACSTAWSDIWV